MRNDQRQWNKWCLAAVAVVALLGVGQVFAQQQELRSLRGADPVGELADTLQPAKLKIDRDKAARGFVQQPPMIPHPARNYRITLTSNKCMTCHSWPKAAAKDATPVSVTHFRDPNGEELADVAPSRYVCTQCHVEQFQVDTAVDNLFEPVPALR